MQTQTSNALHNAIMEAGSKDRLPMLAPVPVTEGSSETTTERYMENYKNVSQDIRDQLNAEAKAAQIILTRIYNDIYSTVDACPNACEMWKAIERLKQGELINITTSCYLKQRKKIVNSPPPIYDQESSMVAEDDEMSKVKEIDKLMALISLSFKKIYKPTNNNLRTSSNTSRANQDNSPRISKSTMFDNQRIINVAGARENVGTPVAKDAAYHKEKMLLCKQGEAGFQLNAELADWKDNTDNEPEDQELEAHYMYMANSRDEHNVIIDSLDMSYDREQIDQDDDDDLANEGDLLASLIEKLKCEIDDNKNRNKFLETSNKALVDKLKGEIEDFKTKNKSLEASNNHFKEANNKLSKTNELMYKDLKKFQDRYNDVKYASKCECLEKDLSKSKIMPRSFKALQKQAINLELKLQQCQEKIKNDKSFKEKQSKEFHQEREQYFEIQDLKAQLQDKGIAISELKKLIEKLKGKYVETKFEKSSVIRQPNAFKSQRPSILGKSTIFLNSLEKKDYSKSKKCVLNDNHDMCVLHSLNGVNSRTKMPMAVLVSTREPKRTVNQSVATSLRRTIASESTNQKPRHTTRKLYEHVSTVKFGNDQIALILGYGDLVQGTVIIKRAYYVEGLNHNLFSVSQFCDADLEVAFRKSTCYIRDLKGNDLLKATSSQAWLWHHRLSHLNFNTINLLSKNDIVIGLPKLKFAKYHLCSFCELGEAKRKSFQTKTTPSSKRRLQLLHMDLCCPMWVESINGTKYVLVIIDDYSRYTWTYFLRSKDETPEVLIDFLKLVQRGLHAQVRTVRTDKGTEFLNKTLHVYFAAERIDHQTSVAQTPKQNGVVERRNRTLVEAARIMLSAAKVPMFFWAEAIATACFTQNRSLVIPRHEKKPYHIINDWKPSVGYSTQSRAYRVFNKRTRVIFETIHVNFNELPQMASDHVSFDLVPQCQRTTLKHDSLSPGPQCQENVPQEAGTVTTSNELDLLFSLMFDELLNGTTQVVSKSSAVTTTDAPHKCQQQHTTPLNIHTTPDPTCQDSTQAPTVASTENINQAETITENAQVKDDEFINIFCTLIQNRRDTSSHHVDSSHMHTFYQRHHSEHRELKFFLEIQINQSPRGIYINQAKYAQKILIKHGMTSCDSIGTPMATKHLDVHLSGTLVIQTKYQSMVGALMYLTASRPDIEHATCYCARYQAKRNEKHLTTVKRIFRYLKDTINMGLGCPKDTGFELTIFLDSDHAGSLDSRKSTFGGMQFLGGDKLVSWSSKKQDCTSISSAEAEYVSLSAAIAISCNPVQHSYTKHIDVRYHFIKEKVEKGIVELFFVRTEYQLADLFTKALSEERFKYLVRRLGMRCLTPEKLEVLANESA
nr:retrovirus-related Pol polyprotein from transposon TNT 1-94 [Tanacetum cinerariifolium]